MGNSSDLSSSPRRSLARLQLPAALVALWLLFGSAFIAIKIGVSGVDAVPPFLFSGSRFLVAGAIAFVALRWFFDKEARSSSGPVAGRFD